MLSHKIRLVENNKQGLKIYLYTFFINHKHPLIQILTSSFESTITTKELGQQKINFKLIVSYYNSNVNE